MSQNTHIHVLPTQVANKIAAGEVVERPASVLKELLENAIDAGATRIDVEIVSGGRKLVSVRDNGCGMGRDDALLSIEPHATSKIRDVDDIEHITTLGFRGEALAAIASVSRFRLVTCRDETVGATEILISGGMLRNVGETGAPVGTTVEVRDLFHNVPARRKFLRTHQTELAHARNAFMVEALSHPQIGMSLKIDGRMTYELAGGAQVEDRLREMFGPDHLVNLRSVQHQSAEVAVSGFVSLPSMVRSDRQEQYVFVNGRATSAPVMGYAIREGYHTLLPRDRHPSVFLYVRMASDLVDVNVHPTKREVRFRHPSEVRDAVITAIREALSVGRVDQAMAEAGRFSTLGPVAVERSLQIEDLPPTRTFTYPRTIPVSDLPSPFTVPAPTPPGEGGSRLNIQHSLPRGGESAAGVDANVECLDVTPWAWCRVLGQIGSLYVVLETEDGYVLMDPHAAHERVLFEKFMAAVIDGHVPTQSLLMPETVELGAKDALRVRKNLDRLKVMGFGISDFGGDSFVVDAVPATFKGLPAAPFLAGVSQALEQGGARGAKGRWQEAAIAEAACKAAVKARDRLSLEEIERLVVDLARTEMPYTCPHGRPTLIFTSFHELNRKFGRE